MLVVGGTMVTMALLGLLATWMLTKGEAWVDRGAAYFEQKRQEREVHHLQRRAAALGLQLVAAK